MLGRVGADEPGIYDVEPVRAAVGHQVVPGHQQASQGTNATV